MKKSIILMALHDEGKDILERQGYEVLYTGLGKVNAAYVLTKKLFEVKNKTGEFPFVINMGSAGSSKFKTGELVEITKFVQRDMDVTGLGFKMGVTPFEDDAPTVEFKPYFPNLPQGTLGTGDSFLQGKSPVECDVVDMEGYAFAKICKRENVKFACVKYITDGADGNASNDWQANLIKAGEAFANLLKNLK